MDLIGLIGRKKYRLDCSISDVFQGLDKALLRIEIIPNCTEWTIFEEGDRIRTYRKNTKWNYIIDRMKAPRTQKKCENIGKKWDKLSTAEQFEYLHEDIERLRSNAPYRLRVLILKVTDSGCLCEAECFPALYEKYSKMITDPIELPDFHIADAQYESVRFLDQIFIGALGGTPIHESIDEFSPSELYINNTIREITPLIDSLLDNATGEVLICGWVGTHFIPKIIDLAKEGVKIQLITHQPSKAKNQPWRSEINKAFQELCSKIGKENISTNPDMHGRMILVDNKALVGSMDLTSSSLTGPHIEFAIYTEQPKVVRRLRRIFYSKFKPLTV